MNNLYVVVPRNTVIKELANDADFGRNLYNALLELENTGDVTATVKVGKKGKALVCKKVEGIFE